MTCHGKARGYSWKSRSIILETLKVFSWSLKLQECVFCYWKSQEAERLKVDSSMVVIAEWHTTLGGCAIQSGGNCSHDLQAKSWCSKVKIPQDWVRPEANLRQGAWPCCYRDYADETRIYFFLALRGWVWLTFYTRRLLPAADADLQNGWELHTTTDAYRRDI